MSPWTEQVREKIVTWTWARRMIRRPCQLVLANGVYDLLHPGHVENLAEASELGDFEGGADDTSCCR